jgi:hypothetical protein
MEHAEVPLWIKLVYALFVLVLVPLYARAYGFAHFLWFSDLALLAMVPALWLESRLLTSMAALAVLLPELAWNLDFFAQLLTGRPLLNLASYMFDAEKPLYLRALSLFHVPLPILLLWTLHRLGYDPRALAGQIVVGEIVLVLTYLLTDPAKNVNWVFGPGTQPQERLPSLAYLGCEMLAFPLLVYAPLHFALKRIFPITTT